MHMIIFLDPNSKLRTPEDIDTLLSAEFPDEEEEPELLELVKKHMVHTCGPNNPNAPCMKDGKCSKGFPKPFRDETTVRGPLVRSYLRTLSYSIFISTLRLYSRCVSYFPHYSIPSP